MTLSCCVSSFQIAVLFGKLDSEAFSLRSPYEFHFGFFRFFSPLFWHLKMILWSWIMSCTQSLSGLVMSNFICRSTYLLLYNTILNTAVWLLRINELVPFSRHLWSVLEVDSMFHEGLRWYRIRVSFLYLEVYSVLSV